MNQISKARALTGLALIGLAMAVSRIVLAGVSADEAARLDQDLTPMGSERAGNAAGTIPAWTGGITDPPADWKPGQFYPNPFADEKPLYIINSENAARYADVLSPGLKALLKRYPQHYLRVFPSHRTAAYPAYANEATRRNAVTASLVTGETGRTGVDGAVGGYPFPIPQSGEEVVWNHLIRPRSPHFSRTNVEATPTAAGDYTLKKIAEDVLFPPYVPGATAESVNNILFYFKGVTEAPARRAGQMFVVHDKLNQASELRSAWSYNPGQRRVRRAPQLGYDNPWDDGVRTVDQQDIFNGATDRYDWKLVGKRELLIPYNAYQLQSPEYRYADVLKPGHLNPALLRYELHRVWVIEATLKEGKRHLYPRRVMYADEDSWQLVLGEYYDANDTLWRVSESHPLNYYDVPMLVSVLEVHHDLRTGRYNAQGMYNEDGPPVFNNVLRPSDFLPSALRRLGRR